MDLFVLLKEVIIVQNKTKPPNKNVWKTLKSQSIFDLEPSEVSCLS